MKLHYTVTEVSQLIGVSQLIARESMKKGATGWDFPFICAGNHIMVPVHAFNEWYRKMYGIDLSRTEAEERKENA